MLVLRGLKPVGTGLALVCTPCSTPLSMTSVIQNRCGVDTVAKTTLRMYRKLPRKVVQPTLIPEVTKYTKKKLQNSNSWTPSIEGSKNLVRAQGWFSSSTNVAQLAFAKALLHNDEVLVDFLATASPSDREKFLEIQARFIHRQDGGADPSHSKGRYLRTSLKLSGVDYSALDSFVAYTTRVAKALGIEVTGRIPLPTKIKKLVLLKSPHVSKQHRATFARVTHRRLVQVYNASDASLAVFMDALTDKMPAGIMISATEHSYKPLPQTLQS
eukprot:CFRG8484T1